mmetsp:Transcript_20870/g.30216  ORF Transcript_20870/g.30216 Transcript_20870/m.30216 type:complete len:215 (+) Transcript_20870:225-869(+)
MHNRFLYIKKRAGIREGCAGAGGASEHQGRGQVWVPPPPGPAQAVLLWGPPQRASCISAPPARAGAAPPVPAHRKPPGRVPLRAGAAGRGGEGGPARQVPHRAGPVPGRGQLRPGPRGKGQRAPPVLRLLHGLHCRCRQRGSGGVHGSSLRNPGPGIRCNPPPTGWSQCRCCLRTGSGVGRQGGHHILPKARNVQEGLRYSIHALDIRKPAICH